MTTYNIYYVFSAHTPHHQNELFPNFTCILCHFGKILVRNSISSDYDYMRGKLQSRISVCVATMVTLCPAQSNNVYSQFQWQTMKLLLLIRFLCRHIY